MCACLIAVHHLIARPDQEMIIGDIMELGQVTEAAKGVDIVYNFAAIADIDEAHDKPLATATINVLGNMHALEAGSLAEARRFVFASTIYVYSESGSFYRASKQAAERFIETYHERYGLDYSILRYGSVIWQTRICMQWHLSHAV